MFCTNRNMRHDQQGPKLAIASVHLQPAPARPPEREEEEDGHADGRDLARVRVEPARDQRCPDERRAEVARGERYPRYASRHPRRASFVRCGKQYTFNADLGGQTEDMGRGTYGRVR